jgi:hypothetical protein
VGNNGVYVSGVWVREAKLINGSIRANNYVSGVPAYMSKYYTCGEGGPQ